MSRDKNTGSGAQAPPPRGTDKSIAGTRRPPNNDVDKDSRDRGAQDRRPSRLEREQAKRLPKA